MDPLSVSCDFEIALIYEIQMKFRRTEVIGYLFHFKQAIKRKLEDLGKIQLIY